MWSARLSSSQEPDEEKLEKNGEIGGFHPTDDIGGFKKKSQRNIVGVHLSQGLSLPLEQVSESLRARVWAQAEEKSRCHGRVKPGRMVTGGHLSAQPRLDEAGLEERALNSRESRLDPPQDSKAPWKRSSILKRSNSSSIASSSRGVRCWSTWRKNWETKQM